MTTIIKERGILFKADMVRAILRGDKTQTRRIVKQEWNHCYKASIHYPYVKRPFQRESGKDDFVTYSQPYSTSMGEPVWFYSWGNARWLRSPCGQVGDRLWVRETFYAYGFWEKRWDEKKGRMAWFFIDQTQLFKYDYVYDRAHIGTLYVGRATGELGWYERPCIHMPREASRLLLEIVAVRVERVQEISEADAVAEGVTTISVAPAVSGKRDLCRYCNRNKRDHDGVAFTCRGVAGVFSNYTYRGGYAQLFASINGPESWAANPWVFVIDFKVVSGI